MIQFNVDSAFKPKDSRGDLFRFNFSEIVDIDIFQK